MAPLRALLYDIHGNLPALEAVLDDAESAGAGEYVLGGDYALFGAYPRETVVRMHELGATWIRGNTDRWLIDASDAPDNDLVDSSLRFCRERLGNDLCNELWSLPATLELEGALICHASPGSDLETFFPTEGREDVEDRMLAGTSQNVIVFGHSHLQFERERGDFLLVNPGSVGLPFDGDRRAAYALWAGGREFELRRVEYDVDAYVADVRASMGAGLEAAVETLARRLERAAFVD